MSWRVGSKVSINVYDDDRPVCQTHTVADAALIVKAVNLYINSLPPRPPKAEKKQ